MMMRKVFPLNTHQLGLYRRETLLLNTQCCGAASSTSMPPKKFYAVRVGRVPGIYETWEDCQSQVTGYHGNQYKSFATRSEAEQYIGFGNPSKSDAADNKTSGLPLVFSNVSQQQPNIIEEGGQSFVAFDSLEDFDNYFEHLADSKEVTRTMMTPLEPCPLQPDVLYQLEFDGASKGNPGKAGAGALLRDSHGLEVFRVMEALGTATNNVAEYCSLILGLREALARGVKRIRVQGDSKLVCLQVRGEWKLKHPNLIPLCATINNLKAQFKEFSIVHVPRELNSAADSVANAAINLPQTTFAHEFCPNADFNDEIAI